jgi:hypothetical protein
VAAQAGQDVVAVLPDRLDHDERRVDRDALEDLDARSLAVDETVALVRIERVATLDLPAERVDRCREVGLQLLLRGPARDVRAGPEIATGHRVDGAGRRGGRLGQHGQRVTGHGATPSVRGVALAAGGPAAMRRS